MLCLSFTLGTGVGAGGRGGGRVGIGACGAPSSSENPNSGTASGLELLGPETRSSPDELELDGPVELTWKCEAIIWLLKST